MSDRPSSGAHVIARLPVLSDQTRHQLRAVLADEIARFGCPSVVGSRLPTHGVASHDRRSGAAFGQ